MSQPGTGVVFPGNNSFPVKNGPEIFTSIRKDDKKFQTSSLN